MTLAATMLALAAPDMAQAVSDTSQKVGDEPKGWLTVLFLVVAGFAALPVIGCLDVGRGLALAALVLILGGLAFAQGRRPLGDPQHLVVDRVSRGGVRQSRHPVVPAGLRPGLPAAVQSALAGRSLPRPDGRRWRSGGLRSVGRSRTSDGAVLHRKVA